MIIRRKPKARSSDRPYGNQREQRQLKSEPERASLFSDNRFPRSFVAAGQLLKIARALLGIGGRLQNRFPAARTALKLLHNLIIWIAKRFLVLFYLY